MSSAHFLECLHEIVVQYPQHTALVEGDTTLNYQELWDSAIEICHILQEQHLPTGSLIGLNFQKSMNYVLALLGTWMAQHAFLPLSPQLPPTRQQHYRDIAQPVFILDSEHLKGIKNIQKSLAVPAFQAPPSPPDTLAYVIFTSGSSGQAKGVEILHRGIVPVLKAQIKAFDMSSKARSLWVLSHLFDASMSDLGCVLLSGGQLIIAPDNLWQSPELFGQLMHQHQITHLDLPPSLMPHIALESLPPSLECVVIGGEVASVDAIHQWRQTTRVFNVYGPTETTICSSLSECKESWQAPLLGQPLPGFEYAIFDEQMAPAPRGELYISGVGLGRGYLKAPKLTSQRWITHQGKRWYKTGDLVKIQDGEYVFLGRVDRQLKIQGQLMAPEEVEMALGHMGIRAALVACMLQQKKKLVAFVEDATLPGPTLLSSRWGHQLQEHLPCWMLPHFWVGVPELPKGQTGKVDYTALQGFNVQALWKEPSNIKNPWVNWFKDILGVAHEDMDFFEGGGSSLDAIQLMAKAALAGFAMDYDTLKAFGTPRQLHTHSASFKPLSAIPASELTLPAPHTGKLDIAPRSKGFLMTGATGFLGAHVLSHLLQDHEVTCLIRSVSPAHARSRLESVFRQYQLPAHLLSRVQVCPGDLTQSHLGLTPDQWDHLYHRSDVLLHCAAEVNSLKTQSDLVATNVEGTARFFGLMHPNKAFHHVSTLSVFVGAVPCPQVCFEHLALDPHVTLHGGYAQSKWAAEAWLARQNTDYAIWVHRPGLVTGHSKHHIWPDKDWLVWMSEALKSLGVLPQPAPRHEQLAFNLSPVDWVAQGLVELLLASPADAYHLAYENINITTYLQALARGWGLPFIPLKDWRKKMQDFLQKGTTPKAATALLALSRLWDPHARPLLHSVDLFQSTHTQFHAQNAQKHAPTLKHPNLPTGPELLERYLKGIFKS